MTAAALAFRNVSKRYPFFTLDDASFRLEQGQIMGFVGPNGAGKTTSIRILMGLIQSDAGSVELLGCPIPSEQVRAKWNVGHVSDDMRLFGAATLDWHMGFVKSIYPTWDAGYATTLLKRFHLHQQQSIKHLSHGERIKALLLLVLARRPRSLVLDEPTSGLDPVARHEVLAELMDLLQDGERSILFSSHNTLDVEQISDQITFIDRGRIVASDDKEVFLDRWQRLSIELSPDCALPEVAGVVDVTRTGRIAVVTTNDYRPELPVIYAHAGAQVRDVQRMTLEEIFVANVMHNRKERGE
ncbi:MAG: ABC transporter ATP-binding protein [Rhodanobacteraceae bacterium]|nr:ABC transporter ATP-binding protein [Rhodanobacteraceae bacterium]